MRIIFDRNLYIFTPVIINIKRGSVVTRPTDSTTSTTIGQTDTTSGQTSTTSGQTGTTGGQTNGQTSTTIG